MPKRLFVAATRQNEGKTTTSLGLIAALLKRGLKVGFIKPVGQRYVKHEGMKVDEDALLVEQVCGVDCRLGDMSPVAVERDSPASTSTVRPTSAGCVPALSIRTPE